MGGIEKVTSVVVKDSEGKGAYKIEHHDTEDGLMVSIRSMQFVLVPVRVKAEDFNAAVEALLRAP